MTTPPHDSALTALGPRELAARIQHTRIAVGTTRDQMLTHLHEALEHGFDAAMVAGSWVPLAAEVLAGTGQNGTPVRAVDAADGGGSRTVEVREVAPRADAIRAAILAAGPDDTVLVAGRGHETVQEIAGVEHELDDREEVRSALRARAARSGGEGGAGEGRSFR